MNSLSSAEWTFRVPGNCREGLGFAGPQSQFSDLGPLIRNRMKIPGLRRDWLPLSRIGFQVIGLRSPCPGETLFLLIGANLVSRSLRNSSFSPRFSGFFASFLLTAQPLTPAFRLSIAHLSEIMVFSRMTSGVGLDGLACPWSTAGFSASACLARTFARPRSLAFSHSPS